MAEFSGSMGEILASVNMGMPIKGKAAKSKLNKLNGWYPGKKGLPAGQKGNPGTSSIPGPNNGKWPKSKMTVDGRFGGSKNSAVGKASGKNGGKSSAKKVKQV